MGVTSSWVVLLCSLGLASSLTAKVGDQSYELSKLCGTRTAKSGLYSYDLDFCGNTVPDCKGSICQFREPRKLVATLAKDTDGSSWSFIEESDHGKGIKRVLKNGDHCWGTGPRITTVKLMCDAYAYTPDFKVESDTGASCSGDGYVFAIKTNCACSGGCSGMGMSMKMLMYAVFFFVIYMGAGCAYMRHKNKSEWGLESMPHKEFWTGFPGLVLDGSMWCYDKVMERLGKSGSGPPQADTSADIEEAGLLAQQDDDLDDD